MDNKRKVKRQTDLKIFPCHFFKDIRYNDE